MMKILGIFLILAAVSLSGCIGEDVPADVTDDVIVDDVVDEVDDVEDVEDVTDGIDEVDEADDDESEEVDEIDNDGNVQIGDGDSGDYDSVEHFTELRNEASIAFNAAQALADNANVTMTAADAEVLRCQALVDEGQMLLDNRSTAFDILGTANDTTLAALGAYEANSENVTAATDSLVTALAATDEALESYTSARADENFTADDLAVLYDAFRALDVISDDAQDVVDELRAELAAAEVTEAEALEAFNAAVESSDILGVTGMADREAAVVIAQEAADSARLAFETLQEAADGKLTALEAAQDKLNSIVE